MTASLATEWEGAPAEHWHALWHVPLLQIYTSVASTNDAARALADAGAPHGTLVLADAQTAGRGRQGRDWHDTAGLSVLLSIVLRAGEAADASAPGCAPIRCGLATAHAVERVSGAATAIKWPNDVILYGAGKVAGILCEGATGRSRDRYIIAGIGINVNQTTGQIPIELRATATSLRAQTGKPVARAELVGELLHALHAFGDRMLAPLDDEELRAFAARDILTETTVVLDDGSTGVAAGLAPDGALRVQRGDEVHEVRNGTVRTAHPGARNAAYPLGVRGGRAPLGEDT